ncbi:MAG: hypothetical protein A3C30_00585 [Candidatus Levybacteria bacterium RIFCSPHIGHO2_02_FULL_40_18]|nr:MAG: hypothetical protein A2869_03345 [Candidatus Levybacteria bacterium RIFCSPHIGHO2_01_FULL_40_58]OGH27197.1 MAG: hypothetical protein A3C30_00585 [Candidatus Levybacteria bacterium RIFCSPHIGHO2_02_FULL_40_18]OGH31056.1 MAG: hypothetical protein A3E43_05000 [Candidatus Levybacteria bacterium RIFCSPHIGHO2_12_FULL_40_31]OGH40776.1 MAG: hypothetical protein A2894_03440 [Candidatus Levybacteria bacterium RIFCSPLOWO2_01_FULL_40_64]OGH49414.1 MAG: hypothetical protein A3I54_02080 [Candidatus Lev
MQRAINKSFENIKLLSVVIPSYKQQRTIARDIKRIFSTLSTVQIPFEMIVIVDGFLDKTYDRAKKLENERVHIFGYEKNKGKGFAIRYGFSKARGDVIGFIDSGMDIDPTGIIMLLNHMEWYNADIIVGSKLHSVSQVNYPVERKILSWGYRTITHLLFGFKVRDTQVGLKFFRRKVVDSVFPRLREKKFAFDIEVLAVAYTLGFRRIFEAPIKLKFTGVSTITSKNFWEIIYAMLLDTLRVFWRQKITRYYAKTRKAPRISWAK